MSEYHEVNNRIVASRKLGLDFAAFSLIILSHFANYVIYIEYFRWFPDIAVVLAVILLIAAVLAVITKVGGPIARAVIFAVLVTLVLGDVIYELGVADGRSGLFAAGVTLAITLILALLLGRHASMVAAGAFAALLVATIFLPQAQPDDTLLSENSTPSGRHPDLPVILHLVLDEHIGLAGMNDRRPGGDKLAGDFTDFYTRYGFQIFGDAYSQYFNTPMSLASTLNFEGGPKVEAALKKGRGKWTLRESRYFSELAQRGYKARIYQTNYMDFCKTPKIFIENCAVYNPDKFLPESVAELSWGERVRLLINMYYSSNATFRLLMVAGDSLHSALKNYGVELPRAGLWHGRLGPIAVLPTLDRLAGDLSRSTGGTLYFAHLMIPHYPYVMGPDCSIRTPISSWELRFLGQGVNTPESRRRRYAAYYDQIRCTLRELAALFDAMKAAGTYEKAIVIVQGDHGSRITLADPTAENMSRLTPDDHVDDFSTLFAAKMPGLTPGVETGASPLSAILPYLFGIPGAPPLLPDRPEVYFTRDDGTYVKAPIDLTAP